MLCAIFLREFCKFLTCCKLSETSLSGNPDVAKDILKSSIVAVEL